MGNPDLRRVSMSLVEAVSENPHITVLCYSPKKVEETEIDDLGDIKLKPQPNEITWIDIDGVTEPSSLIPLLKTFNLRDSLIDQVRASLRPQVEDYDDYIHIVIRMMRYEDENSPIMAEQVHLVLGKNYVLSIQEGAEGDVFNAARDRIRADRGSIREKGADYLVYVLLEAVIDNYFKILEEIGESVEDLQDAMLDNPTTSALRDVRDLKRIVRFLRKSVWPLREVLSELEREDSTLIDDTNNIHFRRAYEHAIQAMDVSETTRDTLSDMLDIYLSSVSNRLNQVMKTLTVITTIFMPLTFIAGVYGMNFQFMPELHWRYGYPLVLGSMLAIVALMLVYFRRKGWL